MVYRHFFFFCFFFKKICRNFFHIVLHGHVYVACTNWVSRLELPFKGTYPSISNHSHSFKCAKTCLFILPSLKLSLSLVRRNCVLFSSEPKIAFKFGLMNLHSIYFAWLFLARVKFKKFEFFTCIKFQVLHTSRWVNGKSCFNLIS